VTGRDESNHGASGLRLSLREWAVVAAILAVVIGSTPVLWQRLEPLDMGVDYRVPYRLSNDYWTYRRIARATCPDGKIPVIGDSVVWGHYVTPAQTLTHHLNTLSGHDRFANLGVDGIHPAAMAGLMAYHAGSIADTTVILHCNLLWISSARQDLQTRKEFSFNHPDLVPQFAPKIPCYRRTLSDRLGVVLQRRLPFGNWVGHVRIAYFEGSDLSSWTLDHPYENPLRRLTLRLPSPDEPLSPEPDTESWAEKGLTGFDARWVELDTSIQWASVKRTLDILQRRGNRVLVLLGPLNEHMLTQRSLTEYEQRKAGVEAWFRKRNVDCIVPPPLPSSLYADASHPLAEGYAVLAKRLLHHDTFRAVTDATADGSKHK